MGRRVPSLVLREAIQFFQNLVLSCSTRWSLVNKPLLRVMLQLYQSVPEIPTFGIQCNSADIDWT